MKGIFVEIQRQKQEESREEGKGDEREIGVGGERIFHPLFYFQIAVITKGWDKARASFRAHIWKQTA